MKKPIKEVDFLLLLLRPPTCPDLLSKKTILFIRLTSVKVDSAYYSLGFSVLKNMFSKKFQWVLSEDNEVTGAASRPLK